MPVPYEILFHAAEVEHSLPTGVLGALAVQESSLNPWAVRFEPSYMARYISGRDEAILGGFWPRTINSATERIMRATSFGLLQVMGQTAREEGFRGESIVELCEPATGIRWGAAHLARKLRKYPALPDALSAYNAGSPTPNNRTTYVELILARMKG